jgi:diguanylate cyclase (GGDEF)-like protein
MSRFETFGVDWNDARAAAEISLTGIAAYLGYKVAGWRHRFQKLEDEYAKLEQENALEPKTRLLTYPAFINEVDGRTALSGRESDVGRSHGLVLADIDDFKKWNERLTHPGADERALLPVADVLRHATDLACRFGGEEFLFYVGEVDLEGLKVVCERIRERINEIQPDEQSPDQLRLTMAYGLFEQGTDFQALVPKLSAKVLEGKKDPAKNLIIEFVGQHRAS